MLFYAGQAMLVVVAMILVARRGGLEWLRNAISPSKWTPREWPRPLFIIDGWLVLLIAASVFIGDRYKIFDIPLADGSHRITTHGDTSYFTSLAQELDRATPPRQQPARAGLKERAYHMFPHLTTMLIARYSGQRDMPRALGHYEFTVVEVLLCLVFYCLGRSATGSRLAGYVSCSLVYILAIPQAPLITNGLCYFFFTFHPHATSGLEPAALCSPQTYCALPVVMGTLLAALELSMSLAREAGFEGARRRSSGLLAILVALLAAATMRFRVQTFLVLFPAVMIYLGYAWHGSRRRMFGAAILLGGSLVAAQLGEMRMDVYYPDSSQLTLENNMLAHRCHFMNAWPGAQALKTLVANRFSGDAFLWAWQIVGLGGFALMSIAGAPLALMSLVYFLDPRNWREGLAGYSAITAMLALGAIVGGGALCTTYDVYSVGGQSLYLVGWYLLPLATMGVWRLVALLPERVVVAGRPFAAPAVAALLTAAIVWQQLRAPSQLHGDLMRSPCVVSGDEWTAMRLMRDRLPVDAVLLFNAPHLVGDFCVVSALTGRRTFLEYLCMTRFLTGGADDNNEGRAARRDRVWAAHDEGEFIAAMRATGATHLIEHAEYPLHVRSCDALELFWRSGDGRVQVWSFHAPPGDRGGPRLAVGK